MIAHVVGRIVSKELDRVELLTKGGVGYELFIPLSTYEGLPKLGEDAALHTHLVVKEDGWQLFGFTTPFERRVFQRVLNAKGVGPALALGKINTKKAERRLRAIREQEKATETHEKKTVRKKREYVIIVIDDKRHVLQVDTQKTQNRECASADKRW